MTLLHFNKYIAKTLDCCVRDVTIICDLDGTLIHTDKANWYAYRKALNYIAGRDLLDYKVFGRATRETIAHSGAFKDLSCGIVAEVVKYKQQCFEQYLCRTVAEMRLVELVRELYQAGYNMILATGAEKSRAELLLEHLQISDCFDTKVFKETIGDSRNKFDYIIQHYCEDKNRVFVIENEYQERKKAIDCGIPLANFLCKEYEIGRNDCLQRGIRAFFQVDYGHYGSPNNPRFINVLKNQNCEISDEWLQKAQMELKTLFYHDLLQIFYGNDEKSFVVCVIPRAKREGHYQCSQKIFRTSISEVVDKVRNDTGISVENGTLYIIRHTDTPTTHLGELDSNGRKTYKGITNDTCTIDTRVRGKSILLIDDIYTEHVNIDEDAIQSLYDNGAKEVMFYSVCRTPKRL